MSMVRWKLVNILNCSHTYGYITKSNRIALGIPKSHANDAFVIAGGREHLRASGIYFIRQVRKCNRKLFKGDRSHIKNTAPREIFGFRRYDKVKWNTTECFIFGRRSTGYFDIRAFDGTKIHPSTRHSTLTLLERAGILLIERRDAASSPWLKPGVSAAQKN
jgi:hypothetical protein